MSTYKQQCTYGSRANCIADADSTFQKIRLRVKLFIININHMTFNTFLSNELISKCNKYNDVQILFVATAYLLILQEQ